MDLVHLVRSAVDAIDFDNSHVVVIDGEHVVWIAGHRDQSNTIAEQRERKIRRGDRATERVLTHRLPNCTLITASSEATPPE